MTNPKLTELQAQVYRYILKNPAAVYSEIQKELKFKYRGSVQSVVRALSLKGLVALYKNDGKFQILRRLKI